MDSKKLRRIFATLSATAVLGAIVIWSSIGYPSSFAEARFLHRLSNLEGAQGVKLAELMPGNWELVCDSHGYEGPMYIKRYDRTYPPAAPPQDGVWGLIFITPDGDYVSAVGSCGRTGVSIEFGLHGCLSRDQAILKREGTGECVRLIATP